MKRMIAALGSAALLLYLLVCSGEAAEAARAGLLLWYQNLVPVLLPFMILSGLMIRMDLISLLLRWIHPLIHLIWGTTVYGSYAVLAGFLFGCPMGAKTLGDLLEQKLITPEEAEYLIGFINNLSPAFLVSFVVGKNLEDASLLRPVLLILYGAPILTSFACAPKYRRRINHIPGNRKKASEAPFFFELLDACIFDGISSITRLGVYIMLFSVLGETLNLLPIKSAVTAGLLRGSIEVTSGIRFVCQTIPDRDIRCLLCMILCSFGGICAFLQTMSVYPMKRRILLHYLKAKTLTTVFAVLLTFFLLR